MNLRRQRIFIFLFPLLLAAPFLNRAYFVDDHYFVEIAAWLKDHPLLPYHFRVDDAGLQTRGIEEDGFVRMVNPLGHQYFLALMMAMGVKGWGLRLACVILGCFAAFFIFELARRLVLYPFWSTLMVLVTPAFWLSSYSLLIDGTLIFLFCGALYFFIRGTDSSSGPWFLLSGIFMGLAVLTKYPALLILPLTAVWLILFRRHVWKKAMGSWIICLLFLLVYSLWTQHLYGRAHILGASGRMVGAHGWPKYLVFLVFMSGSTLALLLSWLCVRKESFSVLLIIFISFSSFFSSVLGRFSVVQSLLLSLWLVTSGYFLVKVVTLIKNKKPTDLFLVSWLGGFMALMSVVMGWVAARYFLIVLPALVFLSIRLIENSRPEKTIFILKWSCGFVFILSGLLAYADYRQAAPAREIGAAIDLEQFPKDSRFFYLGDSFTFSYLKDYGWTPAFRQTKFQLGDFILSKDVTMPQVWFFSLPVQLNLVGQWNYPSKFPFRVMDNKGSAGFYASVWGALPFTLSSSPWERFRLFQVVGLNNVDTKIEP